MRKRVQGTWRNEWARTVLWYCRHVVLGNPVIDSNPNRAMCEPICGQGCGRHWRGLGFRPGVRAARHDARHAACARDVQQDALASVKEIAVQSDVVEVVVSESRLLSHGSWFGHVAIIVDNKVYSRVHEKYFTTDRNDYLYRNSYRNSVGYVIRVSSDEKQTIKTELERRVRIFTLDPKSHEYSFLDNSCSSNVADVLGTVGIVAYDPRWSAFEMISPADIVTGLNHSKRVARKIEYPRAR